MLLWLLSAVIALLFHFKCPVSHCSCEREYVWWFYCNKNKKVKKRESRESECHKGIQESRSQALFSQSGTSYYTDWAALTYLSFCIMWTPQHRMISQYNKSKMFTIIIHRLKEIFMSVFINLTMITLNLKIIV